MELGWTTATQALIIAISTIVVRIFAKKDKDDLKANSASHSDLVEVKHEMRTLRAEFNILRDLFFTHSMPVEALRPRRDEKQILSRGEST